MRYYDTVLWWTATISSFTIVDAQSLPYNPTYILRPRFASDPRDIAYTFVPSGSNQQLVTFNISANLSQSNLVLDSVSPNLPFNSNGSSAFIPIIAEDGGISVYTGACNTSTASELWRYTPSNTSTVGNGTWAQEIISTGSIITAQTFPGAGFLSRGLAFSTIVEGNASDTRIYIFGGMCPNDNSTVADWQSEASYSSSMLRLEPGTSANTYSLDTASSRGAPIAEAGFTITGLEPAYSNVIGVDTQQQSFVVVGGHTQTAFINMSQIAVWSLPEEGWSFVTVDSPSTTNTNTELAIKSTVASVDSRSGHSAVLTEDGSSIIVYGGWVGDVTQAADPQLAILDLGSGYGGTGDWKWNIPANQPGGTGMFGHGALMLPGNVMMTLGGYNITSSSNTKRAVSAGTQALFFNATSMDWQTSYTNPNYLISQAAQEEQAESRSAQASRNTKLGLGLGIGLGLLFVIIALAFCCIYSHRLRKRNEVNREKIIDELGTGSFYHVPNRSMEQGGGAFPWANRGCNQGRGQDPNSAVDGYTNLQQAADNALDPVPPVPKPIQRKPLHSRQARGAYQPAGTFDFNNTTAGGPAHVRANSLGTAGAIHPIYEADEEQDGLESDGYGVGIALGEPSRFMRSDSKRYSDPFKDGPSGSAMHSTNLRRSNTVTTHGTMESESPAESREREIQEWVTDWAAADLLLNVQTKTHSGIGRISPTRRAQIVAATTVSSVSGEEDSGRTESNLSERSITTSGISRSGSSSQGHGRVSRSNSLRGFITGMNLFASTPSTVVTIMSPVFDGPASRTHNAPGSSGSSSGKSFTTARSSFPALQAEGETLLPRPGEDRSRSISPERYVFDHIPEAPGSPSKTRPSAVALGKRRGQAGWLGSLRRVFAGDEHSTMNIGRGGPVIGAGGGSPTRVETTPTDSGPPPRRALSAGATLWRRKQGRQDWDDSEEMFSSGQPGYRSSTFTDVSGIGSERGYMDDDEEWDIERAVQNRVVQVMFTVPKERLRVVNHDFEEGRSVGGGSAGSSLRSKKGSGGKRSMRGVFAVPPIEVEHAEDEPISKDIASSATKTEDQDETVMSGSLPLTPAKTTESGIVTDAGAEERLIPGSGRSSPNRRKATKVLEMVDKMEGRNSPERV